MAVIVIGKSQLIFLCKFHTLQIYMEGRFWPTGPMFHTPVLHESKVDCGAPKWWNTKENHWLTQNTPSEWLKQQSSSIRGYCSHIFHWQVWFTCQWKMVVIFSTIHFFFLLWVQKDFSVLVWNMPCFKMYICIRLHLIFNSF